ncbi:MAG: hypothetical protein J5699_07105 [Bacteroidales bacterium]|nr:hypothetical protein [Bacteroidales bacterium]
MKGKTLLLLAVAALISSSCVTFSTRSSDRGKIAELALTQLNIALANPITVVNRALAGPDSLDMKTPGKVLTYTVPLYQMYRSQADIHKHMLKVTCLSKDSWMVEPDESVKETVYCNVSFLNFITLVSANENENQFESSFMAIEDDQNGYTAEFGSNGEGIEITISCGALCDFQEGIFNINNVISKGRVGFEYFLNGKTLDWCKAEFSGKTLTITTSQD